MAGTRRSNASDRRNIVAAGEALQAASDGLAAAAAALLSGTGERSARQLSSSGRTVPDEFGVCVTYRDPQGEGVVLYPVDKLKVFVDHAAFLAALQKNPPDAARFVVALNRSDTEGEWTLSQFAAPLPNGAALLYWSMYTRYAGLRVSRNQASGTSSQSQPFSFTEEMRSLQPELMALAAPTLDQLIVASLEAFVIETTKGAVVNRMLVRFDAGGGAGSDDGDPDCNNCPFIICWDCR